MTKVKNKDMNNGPMLNAYPDSMGGTLADIVEFLKRPELAGVFSSFYILPSVFNTDLDRGFSVIDYSLNEMLAQQNDLDELENLKIDLKMDFVLNHASVLSKQFQDILRYGKQSKYKDFFIDWNQFWQGHGDMTEEGYIQPTEKMIEKMFFRKPGLPILMVRMPDGTNVPYWNTFYQEVQYPTLGPQDIMDVVKVQYSVAVDLATQVNAAIASGIGLHNISFEKYNTFKEVIIELLESKRRYLGQMDLNVKSPLVWEFYEDTLKKLSEYGAKIVRLDAFAYASKELGEKNFFNDPGTWELLEKVRQLANKYHLTLLPEIHMSYEEKNYETIASKGYLTYDFFLPGLVIDALERGCGKQLVAWANELQDKKIRVVNMLGCHDGIPLLDLKGMISDERIEELINTVIKRGGYVKNLHGQKNVYYQVNATYYSALGEEGKSMLLARAIQLFMPGKPQIWYLDLFAGKNDFEAVKKAGAGGHKEINRTNLAFNEIEQRMSSDVVQKQLDMIRFRASCPAFSFDSTMTATCNKEILEISWEKEGCKAILIADLVEKRFEIKSEEFILSI